MANPYLQPKLYDRQWIQTDNGDGSYARYSIDLLGAIALANDLLQLIRDEHIKSAVLTHRLGKIHD